MSCRRVCLSSRLQATTPSCAPVDVQKRSILIAGVVTLAPKAGKIGMYQRDGAGTTGTSRYKAETGAPAGPAGAKPGGRVAWCIALVPVTGFRQRPRALLGGGTQQLRAGYPVTSNHCVTHRLVTFAPRAFGNPRARRASLTGNRRLFT